MSVYGIAVRELRSHRQQKIGSGTKRALGQFFENVKKTFLD